MSKARAGTEKQTRRHPRVSPAEQLSTTEMGERLGMTRQHVNRLAREGKLVRVPGSQFFDTADPVNARFIAEHKKIALPAAHELSATPAAARCTMTPRGVK